MDITVSQTFLVFVRFCIQVSYKMPLYWNYWVVFFFLMIRPGVVFWGEEDHRDKVSFFTKWCQGYVVSTWFLACWYWAWSPGWHRVQWFFHCKLMLSFPLHFPTYSLTGDHYVQPILPEWKVILLLFESRILTLLFKILLQGRLVSSPQYMYLLSHVFISV